MAKKKTEFWPNIISVKRIGQVIQLANSVRLRRLPVICLYCALLHNNCDFGWAKANSAIKIGIWYRMWSNLLIKLLSWSCLVLFVRQFGSSGMNFVFKMSIKSPLEQCLINHIFDYLLDRDYQETSSGTGTSLATGRHWSHPTASVESWRYTDCNLPTTKCRSREPDPST